MVVKQIQLKSTNIIINAVLVLHLLFFVCFYVIEFCILNLESLFKS